MIVILLQMLKRRSDAIYLTEMGAFIARRINQSAIDYRKTMPSSDYEQFI